MAAGISRELKGLPPLLIGAETSLSVLIAGSYSKKCTGEPQNAVLLDEADWSHGATRQSTLPLGSRAAGASLAPVTRPAVSTGK
jgi:hypothetical protein